MLEQSMTFLIVKGAIPDSPRLQSTSHIKVPWYSRSPSCERTCSDDLQSNTQSSLTGRHLKDTKLSDGTARNTSFGKHFFQSNASTACSDASPGN